MHYLDCNWLHATFHGFVDLQQHKYLIMHVLIGWAIWGIQWLTLPKPPCPSLTGRPCSFRHSIMSSCFILASSGPKEMSWLPRLPAINAGKLPCFKRQVICIF